ncbi:ABC transporter permease [Nocardioides sp.]|uniref:ABC transporter permease n=1 Tax=Nocardioides sp. TaxID=35761 RepID=UPI0035299389
MAATLPRVEPDRRLSAWDGVGRQVDYWLTVYRRTWRGSVVSSFLVPLFNVLAFGVLLGGFVSVDPARLDGASSYLAFIVPGMLAAQSMQTAVGETTYPVMGMIQWNKVYYSMRATPLRTGDLVAGHFAFILFRLGSSSAVFVLVVAPFGLFATWWGAVAAWAVQLLVGMAFATVTYAYSVRLKSPEGFGLVFRLGVLPLVLFSGSFFPIANLGSGLAWVARLTPLWHGVDLTRMLTLGTVDAPIAALHLLVLSAMTAVGWWLSVRGLAKRMAD